MTSLKKDTQPHPQKQQDVLQGLVKYIRVRSKENARFVEFDFAIGDPSLFVELVMPHGVFEQFCQNNNVVYMTDEQMRQVDAEMDKWRYGENTLMSDNHGRSNNN